MSYPVVLRRSRKSLELRWFCSHGQLADGFSLKLGGYACAGLYHASLKPYGPCSSAHRLKRGTTMYLETQTTRKQMPVFQTWQLRSLTSARLRKKQ